jgi:hypothetical protein
MQVALPDQRRHEPARSTSSGRPSQMQVALPNQSSRSSSTRFNDYPQSSRQAGALSSIREFEPSQHGTSSQLSRSGGQVTSPMQHTLYSNWPQGMRTQLVNPGEPHQFGSRADYDRGEIVSMLCRCEDPDSHGDAYTMLNSPRGFDIYGNPIDWQEAKKRMLDHHGKNQISHAEEVAAIPYVYDAMTAQSALQNEKYLTRAIREGGTISVNITENNSRWHNDDGHAKPYLTKGGAKTRFTPGGH